MIEFNGSWHNRSVCVFIAALPRFVVYCCRAAFIILNLVVYFHGQQRNGEERKVYTISAQLSAAAFRIAPL